MASGIDQIFPVQTGNNAPHMVTTAPCMVTTAPCMVTAAPCMVTTAPHMGTSGCYYLWTILFAQHSSRKLRPATQARLLSVARRLCFAPAFQQAG